MAGISGPYSNPYPTSQGPPQQQRYREDAGQNMTDAEYYAWKTEQAHAQQQSQTDIQTNATKDINTSSEGLAEQQAKAEADLQAQAETRRFGMFNSALGGLQGAGGPLAQVSYNGSGVGGAEDAANASAFARAKDQAGQTGRAALNALADVNGARGLTGSRLATGSAANVINTGAKQIGDVTNTQLQQNLQANRQKASEIYQGGITQRGQNIQATTPMLGLIGARY